jgi:hypothetical protein
MDQNRREHSRIKAQVPVQIFTEGVSTPLRGATTDLSLGGCYIENMFPFPVGTMLELKLEVGHTLLVSCTVVTRDPQVGNGILFNKMLPADTEILRAFLDAAENPPEEPSDSPSE